MARNNMLNNDAQPDIAEVIMEEPVDPKDIPAEVAEEVVNEIIEEEKEIPEDTEENQEEQVSNEVNEIDNNISNEEKENVEEPVEQPKPIYDLQVGDRVKIDTKVTADSLGQRIHNGVKNYTYTIKAVRADGFCAINCLANSFTVHSKDLQKI